MAKAIVGCKIWFLHGSVGSIPTTRTISAFELATSLGPDRYETGARSSVRMLSLPACASTSVRYWQVQHLYAYGIVGKASGAQTEIQAVIVREEAAGNTDLI